MGRVRTKTVKRAAKVLLQRHYQKLTGDFHINKKILSEVAKVPTKSLRNKIAGFATHLVKRIQKGPVKGISLKVQEEQRQRRLDWVPKESEINITKVTIDNQTQEMIKKRFGEEFHKKISTNLDVKAAGDKKQGKDGKRKHRDGKQRGERKPKQQKQKKQEKAVEQAVKQVQPQQAKQQKPQAKREGRKRGQRQGQQ